jgi:hypothetical protein
LFLNRLIKILVHTVKPYFPSGTLRFCIAMISERPSPQERSQDALYYDYKRVNLLVRISWASEDMDSSGASANPGRGFGISEFRRLSRFYGVFGAVFQTLFTVQ